jgi:hypothetical protein
LYRLLPAFIPLLLCGVKAQAQEAAQARKLPAWLELGVEFRGRVEGGTAINYIHDNDDIYYLHRIRGTIGVRPARWLRFYIQPQNAEAAGRRPPVPETQAGTFDFHQSFVEFMQPGDRRWSLRAGRQEINFGQQRLVGSANWGNTSRSFDAVRVSYETKRVRMDWFGSTVVRQDRDHLNRFTTDNQLHGAHFSSKNLLARGTFESYLFWKINPHEPNELGRLGRTSIWTAGIRADGPLPRRFDYSIETAIQGGRLGGDDHQAWAGYYIVGYKLTKAELAPRLIGAFTHASGDKRNGDGRFGTFDMLFPTNHAYYGWANRHAWRNIHEVMGGLVWRPTSKWVANFEYHTSWLANLEDALYNFNGRPVVRNPNATSGHTDQELDAYAVFNASRRLQFVMGICRIFPATFLKESTPGAGATVPYLQWRYTL